MQPGPLILQQHQSEIYSLIWALTASCILASFVGLMFARPLAKLTRIDTQLLAPVIIALALVGSYAIDMVIENVILSAVFGVIGFLMIRFDYPRITLVVALVLAALAERNYHQAMLMANESWSIFFTRIPSAVLVVCVLASVASPFVKAYWRKPAAAGAVSGLP